MRRHYGIKEFTVKHLLDHIRDNRLSTETAYQRGRVWKDREKHYLIDSLARGLPIGMITLFSRRDDEGTESLEVIDGKQRITTIYDFVESQFTLPQELASEIPTSVFRRSEQPDSDGLESPLEDDEVMRINVGQQQRELLQGKLFKELKQSVRTQFHDIVIPAFVVSADRRHLAIDIFVRMNKNVKGLVPQEIRNAVYHNSEMLKAAARISRSLDRPSKKELESSHRWFCRSGFMKPDRFDRGADIQFILELLVLQLKGPTHRRDLLDVVCEQYIKPTQAEQKLLDKAEQQVLDALKKVSAIVDKGFKHYSFPTTAQIENDVYAMVGALLLYDKSLAYVGDHKDSFGDAIRQFRELATSFNQIQKSGKGAKRDARKLTEGPLEELAEKYSSTYLGGQTNSQTRRKDRIDVWLELLEAVAPGNDSSRVFSPMQRAIIWANSKDKKCAKCGERVTQDSWDAGHRTDHHDGGLTTVENGQIEHKHCNRSTK